MQNQKLQNNIPNNKLLSSGKQIPKINLYQKKILNLKHKIISHIVFSAVLLLTVLFTNFYHIKIQKSNNIDINILTNSISNLKEQATNLTARVNDAKKFKLLWTITPDKKKNFNKIKISDFNKNFLTLATEYNLSKPTINISSPTLLTKDYYQLKALEVKLVNIDIEFDSLTDQIAINFFEDFVNSFPGYVIISNFKITRNKQEAYSDEELIDISAGKIFGLVSTQIKFSWYIIQNKI